jgi:hypothetical protein
MTASLFCLAMLPVMMAHVAAPPQPTRSFRVDTAAAQGDTTPATQVMIDFGGDPDRTVVVRAFEVGISSTSEPRRKVTKSAPTHVRFTGTPDELSVDLARRVSSGARFPKVDALLPGAGDSGMILHLYDVQVVSARLMMNDDNTALVQQRLALEESIAQLTGDLQEAQRQLDAVEVLAKRQLSPSLELARARANAEVIFKRLTMQRERLALVERQLARWTPMQEEVQLEAASAELEARAPSPVAAP